MSQREYHEQCTFLNWCCAMKNEPMLPHLHTILAIPNGSNLAKDKGSKKSMSQGNKLKKEGMRAGAPDMLLPVPRNGYGALFLELKRPEIRHPITGKVTSKKGVTSKEQKAFHELLRAAGNKVVVCFGKDEAVAAVLEYYNVNQLGSGKIVS